MANSHATARSICADGALDIAKLFFLVAASALGYILMTAAIALMADLPPSTIRDAFWAILKIHAAAAFFASIAIAMPRVWRLAMRGYGRSEQAALR
ncbi:MAG: hypothetical protein IBJ15_04990 [Alphaproteobacteria bacterium]|nr:hypothetical protein [Alphaproteobacteria bacterium]